jgi:integrase
MSLGKQAKVLKDRDVRRLLNWIETSRYPERDKVITLLSFKAGLRAKEISRLTWGMVTGADGEIGDVIALTNSASKGKIGGREIPINGELKEALRNLRESVDVDMAAPRRPVVFSERCLDGMSPAAVADWFYHRYHDLGVEGASSHSGRRTFITMLPRITSRAAAPLEMCSSSPAIPRWRRRSAISKAMPRPSVRRSPCSSALLRLARRGDAQRRPILAGLLFCHYDIVF